MLRSGSDKHDFFMIQQSSKPHFLRSSHIKRFLFLYLSLACVLLAFYLGVGYGKTLTKKQYEGRVVIGEQEIPGFLKKNVDFDLFWNVWSRVQSDFYKQPVLDTTLFYGAVEGLVASLNDPYSNFMNPEITKEFLDDISGSFEGIGAEIGFKNQVLTIISPLPQSPAEKAGLRAGDLVLKIDEKETFDLSLFEAVKRIKGPKGSQVILEILREGEEDTRDITITRDTIVVHSLTYEVKEDVGYVKISSFHEDTESLFKQALKEFDKNEINKLIIDVRNNPGGFLETAVQIASYWIPKNEIIVKERHTDDSIENFYSKGPSTLQNMQTVVLINEGSASASEIVAGALQDYGYATLIGEKSFGKGSVQTFTELPGGASLKITIAEWLTPKDRHIHEVGISPDQEIIPTKEQLDNQEDPQLEAALSHLRQE